jgi:hypothetical protein
LGVERVVVDILVVHAILLTTSNADLLHRGSDYNQMKAASRANLPSQAIASMVQHASGIWQ